MTPAPRAGFESEVRALYLAAGASRRFGADKLRQPLAGRPLALHAASTIAEAIAMGSLAGGVMVVPNEATASDWQLDTLGMDIVTSPDAARGLSTSLRLGLEALGRTRAGAALVALADQPLLRVEVIVGLVHHWRATGRSVRPRYTDAPDIPGHPVLLDRSAWRLAKGVEGDVGLGSILRHHRELIDDLEVPGDNPDIDSPEDLRRLEGRP
jgi:CTP:molybdopterin cytidylyltransferase MocA